MGSLRDQLDETFAPGWKPEPGDEVEGIVTSMSERDGGYGTYPIATIQVMDSDGNVTKERLAIHCTHTVLRKEITERAVGVGTQLCVRYLGKQTSKGGVEYQGWRVVTGRPDTDTVAATKVMAAEAEAQAEADSEPF